MISINGVKYKGNNISISNGNVLIDGKRMVDGKDIPKISIVINSDIDHLEVDSCDSIKVTGSVYKLKSVNGDVTVKGNVLDGITTVNGDVRCGNVGGKVSTVNGDIKNKSKKNPLRNLF